MRTACYACDNSQMQLFPQIWFGLILNNRFGGVLRAFLFAALVATPLASSAEPLAAPGDTRLRHDLQLLSDSGVINVPLTAWPIALGDIHVALHETDTSKLNEPTRAAYDRVREHLAWELDTSATRTSFGLAASELPRISRRFESTP